MKFLKHYKKRLLIFIFIILILSSIVTLDKKSNTNFISNIFGFVITPLQNMTTSTSNWIEGNIENLQNTTNVTEENEKLKEEIERLTAENKNLSIYKDEYDKLAALLELSQKYTDFSTTGTQIIGKDPGNWYDTFIIDKGTKDGLTYDMVLMSNGGLVGKITESGYNYSKARSILDNRSSISAISLRTGDLGVVKGEYALMNNGLCKMEYIDADAEILVGDEIVTSNLSDVYPPGISIGIVNEIRTDANGLTKYAIIQPQVDFKHLDTLLVINQVFTKELIETEE